MWVKYNLDATSNIFQDVRSAEAENAASAHTLAQQSNCVSVQGFFFS